MKHVLALLMSVGGTSSHADETSPGLLAMIQSQLALNMAQQVCSASQAQYQVRSTANCDIFEEMLRRQAHALEEFQAEMLKIPTE